MNEALLYILIGGLIIAASLIGISATNTLVLNPVLHELLDPVLFFGLGVGFSIWGLGFARGLCGDSCRSNNDKTTN